MRMHLHTTPYCTFQSVLERSSSEPDVDTHGSDAYTPWAWRLEVERGVVKLFSIQVQ